MRLLRYLYSPDERPTPPPLNIDDDSGDYWVGVQRCFAGIAIAATLATNALAAQLPVHTRNQPDEIPTPPPFAPDEDAYQPPPPVPDRWSAKVFIDDDVIARITVDEDYQYVPFVQQGTDRIPVAFQDDDPLPPHAFEDDSWSRPVIPEVKLVVPSIDPDEIPAGSLYGVPDEAYALPNPASQPPPFVQQLWDTEDDFVAPATVALDEDYALPNPATQSQTVPRPFTDDDPLPAHAFEDDRWTAPVVVPSVQAPRAFTDDSDVIARINVDEDYPFVARVQQGTEPVNRPFVDDEVIARVTSISVDEDYQFVARAQFVEPVVRPFTDDDTIERINVDEDYRLPIVVPSVDRVTRVFTDDDPLPPHAFEDDSWRVLPNPATERVPRPFLDDDPLPVRIVVDEDYWFAPFRPIDTTFARVFADADELAYPTIAFDEDGWMPPLPVAESGNPAAMFLANLWNAPSDDVHFPHRQPRPRDTNRSQHGNEPYYYMQDGWRILMIDPLQQWRRRG